MSKNKKFQLISIIVPGYNEEENIDMIVPRLQKLELKTEIILVDDGSVDSTYEKCLKQSKKYKNVKVVHYPENRGKGYAIKQGIKNSEGDIVLQIDADAQFLPEEVPKLIDPILKGNADVTFGSRFMEDSVVKEGSLSNRNRIANKADSWLTSIFAGNKFTDIQAGFKAFSRDAIDKIDFKEDKFGYEPEIGIIASKKNLRIVDVPITYAPREGGTSNIKIIQDSISIFSAIIKAWVSN
ncbi:MAG: glycosyltransferase [Candidatus Aenigmarchaeota archaeon]|nr:glycosyltransferase [Candidatus Aenigmarchaeota archaeon]